MHKPPLIRKILKFAFYKIYHALSRIWLKLDRLAAWGETRFWIENIPGDVFTEATYSSYAGWMQNQGVFAAFLSIYLEKPKPNILDFGCGMGNLAPVCHYFVKDGGKYLGIDLDQKSIAACHKTYTRLTNCSFYLTSDRNSFYAPGDQPGERDQIDWPVTNKTQDLVIAMSVFTHLQEKDSIRYFEKVCEVLADDGMAIFSFLVIRDSVSSSPIFNFTHRLTPGWFTSHPECPEIAIGVTKEAMLKLLTPKFTILRHIEGCVTGGRSPLLQDIVVLRRL